MTVYTETNFVLELALERGEQVDCAELLALSRSGRIRVVLPSFSVGEPYEAWTRRTRQRAELSTRLQMELSELGRSQPYADTPDRFAEIFTVLGSSSQAEKERLDDVLTEMLDHAAVVPITGAVLREAKRAQIDLGLGPQDSIVFASILHDLRQAPPGEKCFVTKNTRDFNTSPIRERLAEHDCRLLTRFSDALGFVRSRN
jgi:hypothetical protein